MDYFITEQFLKDNTPISDNVSAKMLAPFIKVASDLYVQPILGYNFTNDLLTKYNASTLNAKETELVDDFISYMVAYYTTYEALPTLSFKISNKGLQSMFGDYEDGGEVNQVEYVRNQILSLARKYERNMRSFLELNEDEFPLYSSESNKEIVEPDNKDQPFSSTSWL